MELIPLSLVSFIFVHCSLPLHIFCVFLCFSVHLFLFKRKKNILITNRISKSDIRTFQKISQLLSSFILPECVFKQSLSSKLQRWAAFVSFRYFYFVVMLLLVFCLFRSFVCVSVCVYVLSFQIIKLKQEWKKDAN